MLSLRNRCLLLHQPTLNEAQQPPFGLMPDSAMEANPADPWHLQGCLICPAPPLDDTGRACCSGCADPVFRKDVMQNAKSMGLQGIMEQLPVAFQKCLSIVKDIFLTVDPLARPQ